MRRTIILLILTIACKQTPVPLNPLITIQDLRRHESFLTDDRLEGREAGSVFDKRTAEYIRECFMVYNLVPMTEDYFQEFEFISGVEIGKNNFISTDEGEKDKLSMDTFSTLGFSSSSHVYSDLVFAGYGITALDQDYNDYQGLDVQGKIVVVLRYSPDGIKNDGAFAQYSPLRYKAVTARENGAVGIIFVTGPMEDNNGDRLRSGKAVGGKQSVGIPAIHMKRRIIDDWLLSAGHPDIEELQQSLNGSPHSVPATHSFVLNKKIVISTDVTPKMKTSRNVIGAIPGSGALKNEWIIVGAHMDHLGWGGEGSTSMAPDLHEIHNGADDNASGTSALLELAASMPTLPLRDNRRSVMFIAFGAEEAGLLGSANYVEHPLIPLENTAAMLNMDMVGRLRDNTLIVSGTGTSDIWEKLMSEVNADSLMFTFDAEGFGSSDHQSFYLKNIPVLFFFTGAHEDYHRPSDDFDKLNFPGIKKITDLAERTIMKLLYMEQKPTFIKGESRKHSSRSGRGYSVTFGVVPDFIYNGDGFKISGVREKAPAGKAGMLGGDIIISINNIEVLNIQDYMYALQSCKAGVAVPVTFLRGDEKITLNIAPQGRED